MGTFEKTLEILANFAELAAGIIIIFSVIKVWPAFTNLARVAKRIEDFSEEYTAIEAALSSIWACRPINSPDDAVEEILLACINDRASDLHVELHQNGVIRYRRNGELRTLVSYPARFHTTLVDAFRQRADIQQGGPTGVASGRIRIEGERLGVKDVLLRLNFVPANTGEVVTIRVLDPSAATMAFDAIGIADTDLDRLQHVLGQNKGLMIFSGPTGSGKTVSLYTSMHTANDATRRVITIEDPLEVELDGITQLPVLDAPGHRLQDLYSAVLRMDPDVIMLGEIHDEQTARMVVKAQAAYLVLTTMFSENVVDCLEKLYRLLPDLNPNHFFMMNQRLNRRPCQACAVPRQLDQEDRDFIKRICDLNHEDAAQLGNHYLDAVGCEKCEAGYRGRVGGYETLLVTPKMIDLLKQQAPSSAIWAEAIAGGTRTLSYNLLVKASQGLSTLAQVRQVTELTRYEAAP